VVEQISKNRGLEIFDSTLWTLSKSIGTTAMVFLALTERFSKQTPRSKSFKRRHVKLLHAPQINQNPNAPQNPKLEGKFWNNKVINNKI
jgi:adenylate cyclase